MTKIYRNPKLVEIPKEEESKMTKIFKIRVSIFIGISCMLLATFITIWSFGYAEYIIFSL